MIEQNCTKYNRTESVSNFSNVAFHLQTNQYTPAKVAYCSWAASSSLLAKQIDGMTKLINKYSGRNETFKKFSDK